VFDVGGWYEWATSAVTKYCYKGSLAFTKGKIYKVEIEMRDGAAAPTDLQIYFYDGAEQVGLDIDTANPGGAFTKYTWTFECATTTVAGRAGIKAPTSLGGNEIDFQDFSCYEITPCCTIADTRVFDGRGWTKDLTLDLYREHWDGGTNTKEGSFYALRCVPTAVNDYINWHYGRRAIDDHLALFYGRTVTIGMWAKTSTPNHFRINMYEGGGTSVYSDYHAGDGNWEWLEATITYLTTGTYIYMQWSFAQPANIDGSTIVYLSQPMLIFGNTLGERNYKAKPQETIWLETCIESQQLTQLLLQGNIAFTDINLEADSDAKLPKGAKAFFILNDVSDTGSIGAAICYLTLRADGNQVYGLINAVSGKASSFRNFKNGWQKCDQHGDFDFRIAASGGATFNCFWFKYLGVQVN